MTKNTKILNNIKITPVELLGLKAYADLQNASKDTPSSAEISIPQLYDIVKSYNKKYENPNVIGRPDSEAKIEAKNEFSKKEHFRDT